MEVASNVLCDGQGKPAYAYGIILDVTWQKQTETALWEAARELEQSQEKYRLLVENASEAIGIIQDNGFQFPNKAALKLFGYDEVPSQPLDLMHHLHPLDVDMARRTYDYLLANEKTTGSINLRIVNEDGDLRWIQANLVGILWENKPAVLSILRDITHEKHLEAKLRQAQKMEAIGTLAGGIAHNFNNILGIIMGFTELTMQDLPSESLSRDNLMQVLDASDRAKDLVSQILTFSRQDSMEKNPVDLVPLVRDTARLLQATLSTSINIETRISGEPCPIMGNATQIKQILMNMGSNAVYAMGGPEGGILSITLDNVEADTWDLDPQAGGVVIPAVRLKISDTGTGMDSETVKRIFDPYFTTMDTGQGTGLGLSVVHGVVKAHKGAISVDSTPGLGTSFTILFPRVEAHDVQTPDKPGILMGNGERVLFVDDEPAIVSMGEAMLSRMNYQVTVYQNSLEALDYFRAHCQEFDVVVTDQTMPFMTGEALIRELRKIRPDIPVIACTGHSDYFDIKKARELRIQAFCPKPLSYTAFSEALHTVLAP